MSDIRFRDEIKYKMLPLPSVFMMEADFPIEHVDTLNTFLDDLLLQEDRLTAADTLVGQIQAGEQLRMDHTHKDLQHVRSISTEHGCTLRWSVL